ncbi:MAG: hypothetical protein WA728_28505 [Xanthobacteraceae bacterium]
MNGKAVIIGGLIRYFVSKSIDALQSSSTSGSVPNERSNRRNPRIHHSLATRTGSHVRIHRTYNPARPSVRQP